MHNADVQEFSNNSICLLINQETSSVDISSSSNKEGLSDS